MLRLKCNDGSDGSLSSWEKARTIRKFLEKFSRTGSASSTSHDWKWGYAIYRTVYTSESDENESDEKWDAAIEKLEALMFREIDRELWWRPTKLAPIFESKPPFDATVNEKIKEHMKNHFISDKGLYDNASFDQIRGYFSTLLQSWDEGANPKPNSSFCLVIDEEALKSLIDAPQPIRDPTMDLNSEKGYVKAIDISFDPATRTRADYEGWMKINLNRIFNMYELENMEEMCPWRDEETGEFPPSSMMKPSKPVTYEEALFRIRGIGQGSRGGTQRGSGRGTQRGPRGGTQRGPPGGMPPSSRGQRQHGRTQLPEGVDTKDSQWYKHVGGDIDDIGEIEAEEEFERENPGFLESQRPCLVKVI
jgi:hypothetical protein